MKTVSKVAKVVGVAAGIALIASGAGAPLGAGILASTQALTAISVGAALVGGVAGSLSRPKVQPPLAIGNVTEFRYQAEAGIPIIVGRSLYAGIPVHRDGYPAGATPTPNPYLSYVIDYSIGPVEGLESFIVDDEPVVFAGGAATGKYAGFM